MSVEKIKAALKGRVKGVEHALAVVCPRAVIAAADSIKTPDKRVLALRKGAAGALEGVHEDAQVKPVYQLADELFHLVECAPVTPSESPAKPSDETDTEELPAVRS